MLVLSSEMARQRIRIACAAFGRARKVVADAIRALKVLNRGLDFKNPLDDNWIRNELNVGRTFVSRWQQVDVVDSDFSDHLKGVCGAKRKLSDEDVELSETGLLLRSFRTRLDLVKVRNGQAIHKY